MKKQISQKLLKSLLHSDFLILENKNLNHSDKIILNKSLNIYKLNPIVLLKTLKQFIRLIQFSSSFKEKNLILKTNRKEFDYVLKEFNSIYSLNLNINSYFSNKDFKSLSDPKMFLFLDHLKHFDSSFINKFVRDKNYLLQVINNEKDLNNSSVYKIFNNLDNLKKFIFLLCLIRQINNINYAKTEKI